MLQATSRVGWYRRSNYVVNAASWMLAVSAGNQRPFQQLCGALGAGGYLHYGKSTPGNFCPNLSSLALAKDPHLSIYIRESAIAFLFSKAIPGHHPFSEHRHLCVVVAICVGWRVEMALAARDTFG